MNKLTKIILPIVIIGVIILAVLFAVNSKTEEASSLESKTLAIAENQIQKENIVEEKENIVANEIVEENVANDEIAENISNIEIQPQNIVKESVQTSENVVLKTEKEKVLPNYEELVYGTSENGRDLVAYSIAPDKYEDTILFVFAIHGYEDLYDKDAQVLVDTAEYLVNYYKAADVSALTNNRLLVVKCANPDGLYDGYTKNGFGRCNAKGIDLNRDFDIIHKVFTNDRNYTTEPFSAKESIALAGLISDENPSVVIDFHGWENCTIGDGNLAKIFKENMALNHKTEFNNNCNGYFSYWAHSQGASALLVEFKDDNISRSNLKMAVDEILETF